MPVQGTIGGSSSGTTSNNTVITGMRARVSTSCPSLVFRTPVPGPVGEPSLGALFPKKKWHMVVRDLQETAGTPERLTGKRRGRDDGLIISPKKLKLSFAVGKRNLILDSENLGLDPVLQVENTSGSMKRKRGCPISMGCTPTKNNTETEGDSIIDSETEVLLRLQTSLDALDEKKAFIKECFLDLGSFPQDQRIPAAALIDMWTELYEDLDKDFLAITNVYELTTRSLADLVVTRKETVEDDDYYSEHFVTQHDLLRQLAVYQAKLDPSKKRLIIGNRGDNLPKCLTEQKHQPIKPRLLSISSDETFSTNLHNIQLADVEVLVLNFNTKSYALPEFVEKMVNLKVLRVTNHGFIPAELISVKLSVIAPFKFQMHCQI
ncbi:probable disease resistance protein At5g66910 [Rosa rugosa]|uniref:probable disease resistance protein At5g66910 n=1 Tax=Rosa rugosa TaxID=74645 RepID=UPI002B40629D|nr:probable disease resistance protein At5g66910 [Rosa rugosa]